MKTLIAFLSFALLTTAASANNLKLDPAKSTIGFTFSQLGVSLKGKFTKFDATLFFDAKNQTPPRRNLRWI
ncbi:MAG: hypothetical protein HC782_05540 [Gammaproteobacteria bacterium]|nr:hypothetical protein [Gammaproteobacteria bacterium]